MFVPGGALPVIVTLFGWASLIKGMLLLLIAGDGIEALSSWAFSTKASVILRPLFASYGAYLTYAGFTSERRSLK